MPPCALRLTSATDYANSPPSRASTRRPGDVYAAHHHEKAAELDPCRVRALLALSSSPATTSLDEHWPQWRGPDGLGVAKGTGYAEEWNPAQNIAWQTPVEGRGHSSLVAVGERILQTSEDGDTVVIEAGPIHEVVRTHTVGEPVWASLAFARGTIFIRGDRHLLAIRK